MLFRETLVQIPTPALVLIGILMSWFGYEIKQKHPHIGLMQLLAGAFSFFAAIEIYGIPMNPEGGPESLLTIFRASFVGLSIYGIVGFLCAGALMAKNWFLVMSGELALKRENLRQQTLRAKRNASDYKTCTCADAVRAQQANLERELEQQRNRVEAERLEESRIAESAKRETARMKLKLKALEQLESAQRNVVETTIEAFLTEEVPDAEFQQRIVLLHRYICNEKPEAANSKGFQSLTELETSFAEKSREIDSLDIETVEKESLASYLAKEKQAAIHQFLRKEAS